MTSSNQEIEVKFCVRSLSALPVRLEALGARIAQPRVWERNLRYDTPGGDLRQAGRVLRLRQDEAVHLTYKGPGEVLGGVQHRVEIELVVDGFDQGRAFLEALGYQVAMAYEKYRTTYALESNLVTLDETPLGSFVEIEGMVPDSIARLSERLGLDWEARINESYVALFERARTALGFQFRDLAFDNFRSIDVRPEHLGVRFAN